MRAVASLVGLGLTGLFVLGSMVVGTAEGRGAIADIQAAEAAMCACDAGDLECGLRAQQQLERVATDHMMDEVSELQAQRFEASANRALACRDTVFGGLF